MQVESKKISDSDSLEVSVNVTNIGRRSGDEVVQLYIHDRKSSLTRPGKQLMGFERISLNPQETKTVSFTVSAKELAFRDVNTKSFVVEPGGFDVMVRNSSEDIRAKGMFAVK